MNEEQNKTVNEAVEIEPRVSPVKTLSEMENEIAKIANENGWIVNDTAVETITMAKMQNFGLDDWSPCPCDVENVERYCGSELCADEVKENGICHCGLFKMPEEKEKKDLKHLLFGER